LLIAPVLVPYIFAHCFFVHALATSEIYPLSLHDALPIWDAGARGLVTGRALRHEQLVAVDLAAFGAFRSLEVGGDAVVAHRGVVDRKSTRLNSSHVKISYAVFCLKKKKTEKAQGTRNDKK